MAKRLNAAVCKTAIRGFESRSHLKNIILKINFLCYNIFYKSWALSSFGRAPVLHSGGERFESARVHKRSFCYLFKSDKYGIIFFGKKVYYYIL